MQFEKRGLRRLKQVFVHLAPHSSRRNPVLLQLAVIGAILGLLFVASRWRIERRSKIEMQVLSIASARSSVIQSWINERVADSEVLALDLSQQAEEGWPSSALESMKNRLELIQKVYKYDGIYLIDQNANPFFANNSSTDLDQFPISKNEIRATPAQGVHAWLHEAKRVHGDTELVANFSTRIGHHRAGRDVYLMMRIICPTASWAVGGVSSIAQVQGQFTLSLKQAFGPKVFLGPPESSARFEREVKLQGVDWSLVVGVREKYWNELMAQEFLTYFEILTLGLVSMGLLIREYFKRRATREHAASESRIREEKNLAQKYLDVVGVMLVVVDASQEVSLINRRGLEILKAKDESDVLGKNWFESFIDEVDRAKMKTAFSRLLGSDEDFDSREMENEVVTLDGERRLISWRNTVLRDAMGKVTGVLSSGEDITEKKRITDEIRETQANLLKAQELAHIGAWTRSIDTDEVIWSPQVFKIFGLKPGEFQVTLESLLSLVHREDRERVQDVIIESGKTSTDFSLDYRILMPDGSIRWVSSKCQFDRDPTGRLYRLFGIIQDITDRKELEENLRAATESAKTATQAKSEFLANISHEVRTPLNAVIGLSYLLTQTELTSEQRSYLDKISFSAKLLLGIISDVLDFSRIEARKLELVEEEFDVLELEGALSSLLSDQVKRKGLRFIFERMPDVPCILYGDRLRLIQVLINLCSNAIKFTDKGKISVQVKNLGRLPDGKYQLQFSVRDTGIGIAKEHVAKLFQSFSQVEGAAHRRFGGAGLGLAISKQIVELMEGQISVESVYRQGSCFSFTLPLVAFSKAREHQRDAFSIEDKTTDQGMSHTEYKILLVEDNEINQMVVKDILEGHRYKVVLAESGLQAIQLIIQLIKEEGDQFDLILMDVQMPKIDGYEASRRIRKYLEEQSVEPVPIVALTAYALSAEREKFVQAGMSAFLTKPIDPVELLKVISKFLSGRRKSRASSMILNVEQALPRLGQKQALYLKLLKMFKEKYARSVATIEGTVAQRSLKACHDYLHNMRGASENISATRISETLRDLEDLTFSDSPLDSDERLRSISEALPAFQDNLQELLVEIDLTIKELEKRLGVRTDIQGHESL
ncbi:MAG: ATP-binding protein [Bdellovibrionia bacterium]